MHTNGCKTCPKRNTAHAEMARLFCASQSVAVHTLHNRTKVLFEAGFRCVFNTVRSAFFSTIACAPMKILESFTMRCKMRGDGRGGVVLKPTTSV